MKRKEKFKFSAESEALARFAKALSHPARLAILETLAKRSTCICGEIVEVLPLAQSTVSQHLRELKDAGLIKGSIDGLKSCYCLNYEALNELETLIHPVIKNLKKRSVKNGCC